MDAASVVQYGRRLALPVLYPINRYPWCSHSVGLSELGIVASVILFSDRGGASPLYWSVAQAANLSGTPKQNAPPGGVGRLSSSKEQVTRAGLEPAAKGLRVPCSTC